RAEIDRISEEAEALAAAASTCPNPADNLRQALQPAVDFASRLRRIDAARARDYDDVEAALIRLETDLRRNKRKGGGRFSLQWTRQEVLDRREQLRQSLQACRIHADADLAALLREELRELTSLYEEAKRRAGKLDFADLL